MLKFLSGSIKSSNGLITKVVVLFSDKTPLVHSDLSLELDISVKYAGFCKVTKTGFFNFYGRSVSLDKNTNGLSRLNLVEFIKNGNIYKQKIIFYNKRRIFYLICDKYYFLNNKINVSISENINFEGLVIDLEKYCRLKTQY